MLVSAQNLIGLEITSIVSGQPVGQVTGFILNPSDLKVLFLVAQLADQRQMYYLLTQSIREISTEHIFIDDEDELVPKKDLVRFQELLSSPVTLLNYKVVTATSHVHLGVCSDFVFHSLSFELSKLYVKAGFWRRLLVNHNIIDVNDIVRLEPNLIVVRDSLIGEFKRAKSKVALPVHTA